MLFRDLNKWVTGPLITVNVRLRENRLVSTHTKENKVPVVSRGIPVSQSEIWTPALDTHGHSRGGSALGTRDTPGWGQLSKASHVCVRGSERQRGTAGRRGWGQPLETRGSAPGAAVGLGQLLGRPVSMRPCNWEIRGSRDQLLGL